MSVVQTKGICIGEGRPKTIVSLMGVTPEELLIQAKRATFAGPDCVEWRADGAHALHDPDAMADIARTLAKALPNTPVIVTVRTAGQGGKAELAPRDYAGLVSAIVRTEAPDLVDVEACMGDGLVRELVEEAHAHGLHAIVSHHDFQATPPTDQMTDALTHMAELGADVAKLAVMAHDPADAARLMQATAEARHRVEVPLVTMAMGPAGTVTRLVGESFGSAATFCMLDRPTAPGQVGFARASAILDLLHDIQEQVAL